MESALELELGRAALRRSEKVVFLTGAGISTDSGIPDFRGPQGVWTRDPDAEKLSNIRYYMASRAIRVKAWRQRLGQLRHNLAPNPGHLAIAAFEKTGRMLALITQNVDGLHQLAGTRADRLIEVHGTIRQVRCMACDRVVPMEQVLVRLNEGEDDPPCRSCGGILKSDTISFGQALRGDAIERATDHARACDCIVAVGTTLQVYPVASLVPLAIDTGALLIIVNGEPTPMDDLACAVIRLPISESLPSLLEH
jgi:NAD-dependent deacetylase